jgi:hypothetical protein
MSTGYVLVTLPKAVRFDHIKGIDSRTKEQRYESLQAIWDNSRIIDDLNDIAVLVKQTQYTSLTKFSKLMIKLSSVDTKAL